MLTECALPGWASDCDARIDTAQDFITGTLPSRLTTLYSSIRAKAPNAAVVVGYPRIFQGEDCNAL
ncbi:MAG: SGNH/GDSL hydrolase family protein, partial [Lapillicoccus sp.]